MITRLLAVVVAALVLVPLPAHAADDERILRYHMSIELLADGTAYVDLEFDYDFGDAHRHGPYLTWNVRQRWDADHDVLTPITGVTASSPTADAAVHTERVGDDLAIRIGTEGRTFTGVHTYHVSFLAQGWVGTAEHVTGITDDELYRNLVTTWDVPIENVTVLVVGPATPHRVQCLVVAGTQPCDAAEILGDFAVMSHARVPAGKPLTVLVQYPAGTFDTAPQLVNRTGFVARPATVTGALLVAGGGTALVVGARRRRRDEHYTGLPPGALPPAPGHPVTDERGAVPVVVRFTPPDNLHPGLVGTVVDKSADVADITATIVDLAVRGYLRIIETTPPGTSARSKKWSFERLPVDHRGLLPYEQLLIAELFGRRSVVALEDLQTTFAGPMRRIRLALNHEAVSRGWFHEDPEAARQRWRRRAAAGLAGSIFLTIALASFTQWALLGVGLAIVALVAVGFGAKVATWTALGSAIAAQAEGFELYLETAEADLLRFEEGEDIFSRYLPFAIAFGVTEHWTRVFEQIAARGRAVPEPGWYVGHGTVGSFWSGHHGISASLAGLATSTGSALSMTASGSSGGASAGGGGGGGGGGSW